MWRLRAGAAAAYQVRTSATGLPPMPGCHPVRVCSPRRFPLLVQVVLGPFLPLVTAVFTWLMDRGAREYNKAHGPPGLRLPAAGAS